MTGIKVLLVAALFLLVSCNSEMSSFFDNAQVEYDPDQDVVAFTIELNGDTNFPVGMTIPIEQYGDLNLIPAFNDENAKLVLRVNTGIIGIVGDLVYELPNGAPFPAFVGGGLVEVIYDDKYYIYVDVDTLQYVGFAIVMPDLDDDFPAGAVITSYFKNDEDVVIAAASVYGPKKEGDVVVISSGLFAVADLDSIIKGSNYEKGYPVASPESTPVKINRKQYKKLKKSGYIR